MLIHLATFFTVGVSCGQLDAPSNGGVNTSDGTSFGDVASYSCVVGYTLNGPAERACQADRLWNGTEPTCESEILEFSVQLCSCGWDCLLVQFMPVYILRYVVIPLLCMSFSIGVSCGQPDAPSNGAVNTSDGTSFGDVARYSCGAGYTVNGPTERTCQADRQWSGSVPTCESEILKWTILLCFCV